jgi:hypothetical protein
MSDKNSTTNRNEECGKNRKNSRIDALHMNEDENAAARPAKYMPFQRLLLRAAMFYEDVHED